MTTPAATPAMEVTAPVLRYIYGYGNNSAAVCNASLLVLERAAALLLHHALTPQSCLVNICSNPEAQ